MHGLAGRDRVLMDQARVFLAVAAGIVSPLDAASATEAHLSALGYRLPRRRFSSSGGERASERPATTGDVALLAMQFFGLRGDLRYEILPSPAAAFRVLQRRQYFAPWERSGQPISGNDIIDLVHRLSRTPTEDVLP